MTARRPLLLAALAVSLVSAYLLGRAAAPTRTVETVTVQRSVKLAEKSKAEATSSVATVETKKHEPTVRKWTPRAVPTPAGCPTLPSFEVVEIVGPFEETKSTIASEHVTVGKERLLTAAVASVSTKTVDRGQEYWGVSGGVLRFKDAHVAVTGSFELRPVKALPFFVVAQGLFSPRDKDWGAGVALKMTGR